MIKNALLVCLLAAAIVGAVGCSVLDGDDRADLEAAIDKEPPDTKHSMGVMAMTAKTQSWLKGRKQNEEVIFTECRSRPPNTATWSEWSNRPMIFNIVADVLACMATGLNYSACIDKDAALLADFAKKDFQIYVDAQAPGTPDYNLVFECRAVVRDAYRTINVPGAGQDLNRVSNEEIVLWLLALPAAPAGFGAAELAPLLPFICVLDVAWGCPGNPGYPLIGTTMPDPSSGAGDP